MISRAEYDQRNLPDGLRDVVGNIISVCLGEVRAVMFSSGNAPMGVPGMVRQTHICLVAKIIRIGI